MLGDSWRLSNGKTIRLLTLCRFIFSRTNLRSSLTESEGERLINWLSARCEWANDAHTHSLTHTHREIHKKFFKGKKITKINEVTEKERGESGHRLVDGIEYRELHGAIGIELKVKSKWRANQMSKDEWHNDALGEKIAHTHTHTHTHRHDRMLSGKDPRLPEGRWDVNEPCMLLSSILLRLRQVAGTGKPLKNLFPVSHRLASHRINCNGHCRHWRQWRQEWAEWMIHL